jgi:transcriptional regulator with XRE-family HTH domain
VTLQSINLQLRELLSDPVRRQTFFRSMTQDEIASQIRGLRKERGLTQAQFADLAQMKQSAVSRIEQAEYSSWTLSTLFRAADALDARIRFIIEDAAAAADELCRAEDHSSSIDGEDGVPGPAAKAAAREQELQFAPDSLGSGQPAGRSILPAAFERAGSVL